MSFHLLLMLIIVLPACAAIMIVITYVGRWIATVVGPHTISVVDGPFVSILLGLIVGAALSQLMKSSARRIAPPDLERLLSFWGIWNQLVLWSLAGLLAAFFSPFAIGIVVGAIVVTFIPVDFELG